jgi:hypothetical protein
MKIDKFDRALVKKDKELEICWARIADLRQLLHDYAKEHDGLSSGTGKVVQCDCINCQKVRQADHWRLPA